MEPAHQTHFGALDFQPCLFISVHSRAIRQFNKDVSVSLVM